MNHNSQKIEVRKTVGFNKWLGSLRDRQAAARIRIRVDRLSLGQFGDVKPVGEGLGSGTVNFDEMVEVIFGEC